LENIKSQQQTPGFSRINYVQASSSLDGTRSNKDCHLRWQVIDPKYESLKSGAWTLYEV
jgi:hypothetical protein